MEFITAQQSRDARRELGLSQTEVAKALDFNRQYLSEFETGFSTRLTNSQLNKLRSFYEEKITEANAEGEVISIKFGADALPASSLVVETFQSKRVVYPVDDSVSDEVLESTKSAIAKNDAHLVELLTGQAEFKDSFFDSDAGIPTEDTLSKLRECFSLLAANYLMLRSISGWEETGLTASNENLANNTLLWLILNEVRESFDQAGIQISSTAQADIESEEKEEELV